MQNEEVRMQNGVEEAGEAEARTSDAERTTSNGAERKVDREERALAAMRGLLPRHRAFVTAYVACQFNGAAAAREVGYSERRAKDTAYRIRMREDVKTALRLYLESGQCPDVMEFWEGVVRLSAMARASLPQFLSDDGQVKLDGGPAQALQEVMVTERTDSKGAVVVTRKIKMRDPRQAILALGEMMGWNAALMLHGETKTDAHDDEKAEHMSKTLHAWRLAKQASASGVVRDGAVE
jgi:hypothetical protein